MRQITRIIVHHSLTDDGATVSWGAIRRFHQTDPAYGFTDIGYHAGIELVGAEYECLYGRPLNIPGAHTAGHNADSLGFCFVGNYDNVPPPKPMLVAAARVVLVPWLQLFGLGVQSIVPHRQFAPKSCPGNKFDLDELRTIVGRLL